MINAFVDALRTLDNQIFLIFIIVVFALACIGLWKRGGRFGHLQVAAPAMLTTIGVLGTFLGIFIGLADFDVANLSGSVPSLLAGMKLAFFTSVAGMSAALLLKALQILTQPPARGPATVGPADVLAALQSIEAATLQSGTAQTQSLDRLRSAIAADQDSSLLTQLQKLRTSFQDGQQMLAGEFRSFAEKMADNNSKALIEALEQVIRDFNTKLNEQFGDNFKQLNAAVGAMVTWQDQYRVHVESLEKRFDQTSSALAATEQSLAGIAGHTAAIPQTMAELQGVLAAADGTIQQLDAQLAAVAELRDKAVNAFPVIESNILGLTETMRTSVAEAVRTTGQMQSAQLQAFDQLSQGVVAQGAATAGLVTSIRTETTKLLTEISEDLLDMAEAHQSNAKALAEQTRLQYEAIGRQLAVDVSTVMARTGEALSLQQSGFKTLQSGFEELKAGAEQTQLSFRKQLDKALEALAMEMNQSLNRQATALDITAKQLDRITVESWSKTQESINRQFQTLDAELQKELQRAITIMAQNLAGVSEKFVSDYTPLTDRLRELLRLAEGGR